MTDNSDHINRLCIYHPGASQQLADMLYGDDLKKRDRWTKFVQETPLMHMDRSFVKLHQQRVDAYDRIKAVTDQKFFSIYDFVNDPVNLFTCHEMLGQIDGSLATKFTVQNNLFGGTLMALSTEQHADFLKKVDKLDVMGCFCFTELGYGNNAPKMETTATYDEKA